MRTVFTTFAMRLFFPAFLLVALAAAGCTSSSGSGSGTDSGASGLDGSDSGTVSCANDPRVDTYVANLVKKSASGKMQVTLVASDPAPPIRGTNAWTMKITDDTGAAVTSDVTVVPFMPDHGHGTSVTPTPTAQPDGSWKIDNLYFFMPGVWRVTITHAGDSVEYLFCVAG